MLWLISGILLYLGFLLTVSVLLAETAWSPVKAPVKTRLRLSLQRIARSQSEIQNSSERILLLFSLTCGLLTATLFPAFIQNLLIPFGQHTEVSTLISSRYAPLISLGLFILLQVAGHISLALTERRSHTIATLLLNGYFWLPLILAWASVTAYLPVHSEHVTRGAVSGVWLVLLQPAGILALLLTLTGPVLLVNAQQPRPVQPVQHWIRELHLFNTVTGLAIVLASLTCFSPLEGISKGNQIIRFALTPILLLLLLGIHYRLLQYLRKQGRIAPEMLWKLTLWLSLISLSASFTGFHLLGMSDYYMHMLLNFSLLAIWWGFLVPKFPFRSPRHHQESFYESAREIN